MRCYTTTRDDICAERAVLYTILDAYPELFTERDLIRLLAGDHASFSERDGIERAAHNLSALGLLHLCGPLIIPSMGALRIKRMEDEETS